MAGRQLGKPMTQMLDEVLIRPDLGPELHNHMTGVVMRAYEVPRSSVPEEQLFQTQEFANTLVLECHQRYGQPYSASP